MNKLDSKNTILKHKKIINKNIFLKKVYVDFYKKLKEIKVLKHGLKIEVGSGGGFLKKMIPEIITTDVLVTNGIDKKLNLEEIPFKKDSVSVFYMLNVFHHVKNPKKALTEMERCLINDGKIIMIEPWPTFFSKFIYQNFHHEKFDSKANWKIKGKGRMSDANGALPWIIFSRDHYKFSRLYPNLKIVEIAPHTPLKYLFSGGLSKPQLLPVSFYPFIIFIENLLSPLNRYLALFATIVITKVSTHTKHG